MSIFIEAIAVFTSIRLAARFYVSLLLCPAGRAQFGSPKFIFIGTNRLEVSTYITQYQNESIGLITAELRLMTVYIFQE